MGDMWAHARLLIDADVAPLRGAQSGSIVFFAKYTRLLATDATTDKRSALYSLLTLRETGR